MNINWFSNSIWARTGYGNQTALFVPRLRKLGHQMSVTAFYGLEGSIINLDGIPIYPRGHMAYGQDIWSAHAHHAGADVCISLMDAWVFEPGMNPHNVPWIPWFPVDMEPLPERIRERVQQALKRIVFSQFGLRVVNDAGLDAYYVPHGVDTQIFKPGDRAKAREMLDLPADRFIVGMVAANKGNPSRKAFTPQLEAFAAFHKKHDDSMLYLHTTKSEHGEGQGVNLPEYLKYLGLVEGRDVVFCDQYMNMLGFPDPHMAGLYNAFDVHLLVSMGEGFGIPILEAQACGCPVIVGDWTSMSELCFSGWKVCKSEAVKWWTPLAAYQYFPQPEAIADRLEMAYQAKDVDSIRQRACAGAQKYDVERVTQKYWKPTLENIQSILPAKLAVQP
jgi:glycosyltransferase involved in cell wall biosynthesis